MEARKEDILKESARITNVENELVKLELIKPQPYGTFHAVRKNNISLHIYKYKYKYFQFF